MTQAPYHFDLEDKTMIEKMFKSLMEKHEMNHIEYKIFNSIQDPANKKTEEHYTNLQGKVADAVSDDHRVKMVLTWLLMLWRFLIISHLLWWPTSSSSLLTLFNWKTRKLLRRSRYRISTVRDCIIVRISVQLLETTGKTYLLFRSSSNWKKQVEGQNIQPISLLKHYIFRFVSILNAITCVREMADIKKARSITQSAYSSYTTQEEQAWRVKRRPRTH